MEADYRDETIQSFAQNILRLGSECRALAEENKRLKSLCDNLGMGGKHTITAIEAENARLKSEVERLTTFTTRTIIPNEELQAHVERLTKQNALATPRHLIASQDIKTLREQIEELKLENSQYEEHHKYGQNVITSLREQVENSKRINTELLVLCNRQASDIRRLTKAGYAMAVKINVHGINDRFTDSQKLVDDWSNAAKEGKQSK
jgi:DNA repair exonuclease SbcCD ATPase subunit